MKRKRKSVRFIQNPLQAIAIAALLLGLALLSGTAQAAGLLIADGGFGGVLEIKEHAVHVTINNGIAVTRITQIFKNTENRQVEALYTFPVPKGASVSNFSMWINGKEMIGEVLEKKRAREIYNSYKRTRRDPGLLEQVDYKRFEMRIFPINADAEQKVQLVYYQELDIDHDRATYVYPLATVTRQDVDTRATGKFAINMDIRSAVPITEMESPSHPDGFVIADHSGNYKQASLENAGGSLADDVVVTYGLSRPQTGIDLITTREPGEDGYFYLTLTAGKELATLENGMDYVFVLDISGSMAHDGKLALSRNSVEAFVDALGPEDRFEIMTFNVNPNPLFGALRPANSAIKTQAQSFMQSQRARGGTVLAPAMQTAYKYGETDRTLNVVILSDGMTEQKERQTLMELIQSRPRFARVFCIGIGNEVNRPLLEQMATDSGGLAAFISHGDNFKRQAQAFRRKLTRPVATNLKIDIDGVRVFDVEPAVLPNLYHGSPVRVYGRYSGSGDAKLTLNADIQGQAYQQSAALRFPRKDPGNPEIERMWAWKRVDRLLKQADRSGGRTKVLDRVISLGEKYSIITEYTSFLVLENDAEYQRWKIERRNAQRIDRDRQAQADRQRQLDIIRNKAVSDLGPQAAVPLPSRRAVNKPPTINKVPATQTSQPTVRTHPQSRPQSSDFNLGSGPVGPLFVGWAYWLARRKKNRQNNPKTN